MLLDRVRELLKISYPEFQRPCLNVSLLFDTGIDRTLKLVDWETYRMEALT